MKLSKFELEVMQIFWDLGEAIVPDVHRRIAETRGISYSAVKTIVDRLEEKGALLRIRTYGRTILYGPATDRAKVARPLVKEIMKSLFSGSVRPLVSHALADEDLSAEDIAYLEQLLAEKKRDLGGGT